MERYARWRIPNGKLRLDSFKEGRLQDKFVWCPMEGYFGYPYPAESCQNIRNSLWSECVHLLTTLNTLHAIPRKEGPGSNYKANTMTRQVTTRSIHGVFFGRGKKGHSPAQWQWRLRNIQRWVRWRPPCRWLRNLGNENFSQRELFLYRRDILQPERMRLI